MCVYLTWNNYNGTGASNNSPFPSSQYVGVPANKLVLGVPASTNAVPTDTVSYASQSTLSATIGSLNGSPFNLNIGGIMFWDSYWDHLNGNEVSSTTALALGLPA